MEARKGRDAGTRVARRAARQPPRSGETPPTAHAVPRGVSHSLLQAATNPETR